MEFKIEKREKFTLIQVLSERIDIHLAPLLKSEVVLISGAGEKNIILDISNCTYCDSEGLNAILTANRLCKNSNGFLVLGGVQEKIEHIITISQLDKVLNIAYNINRAEDILDSLLK